ncbi:MAG: (2Fe-2S)-binding protein [Bdellovibrionia bacterium]
MNRPQKKSEIICFCNNVPRDRIEDAIRKGADDFNKIFDTTSAGIGPCGGSCRRKLAPMLEQYLKDGTFPEVIKPDMTGKRGKPG